MKAFSSIIWRGSPYPTTCPRRVRKRRTSGRPAFTANGRNALCALFLAFLLAAPGNALANTGGVDDVPNVGDYSGSLPNGNNLTITDVKRNVNGVYAPSSDAVNNSVSVEGRVGGFLYGGRSDKGKAIGNKVSVSSGYVGAMLYGGHSRGDEVSRNSVYISGGSIQDVFGGFSLVNTSFENTVVIEDAEIRRAVYGGASDGYGDPALGNVSSCSVELNRVKVDDFAYGGKATNGNVTGCNITFTDGTIGQSLLGGYGNRLMSENHVWMTGGEVGSSVYGGYSRSGDAVGNVAEVSGGVVKGNVKGGYVQYDKGGAATGNKAVISGGTVSGTVYGGHVVSDKAVSGNAAVISGGTVGNSVYGGYTQGGSATGNSAAVESGFVPGDVIGGYSWNGSITGNTSSVSGGTVGGSVYGGYVFSGTAVGNSAAVSGGSVAGSVTGGRNEYGEVTGSAVAVSGGVVEQNAIGGDASVNVAGNSLSMSGGEVKGSAAGGYSRGGDALGNAVSIGNGSVGGSVTGGDAASGSASGNAVTVSGGLVGLDVKGGNAGTDAGKNTVIVAGGEVKGDAVGGYAWSGTAAENMITVSDGTVDGSAYGGLVFGGNASGNAAVMSGGAVGGSVIGGNSGYGEVSGNSVLVAGGTAGGSVIGGNSSSGDAVGNSATVSGGVVAQDAIGGNASGKAQDNTVAMSGGEVKGAVTGGSGWSGDVTKNTVTVAGGTVGGTVSGGSTTGGSATDNAVEVYGGEFRGKINGGSSVSGAVAENTVHVAGGVVKGAVSGGYSESGPAESNVVLVDGDATVNGDIRGGNSVSGNAVENMVFAFGGTVTGVVSGGHSESGSATGNTVVVSGSTVGSVYGGSTASGYATDNTVVLNAGAVKGNVYGGYAISGGGDVRTGNTLEVNVDGLRIDGDLAQFQTYDFYLPPDIKVQDTILSVGGNVDMKTPEGAAPTTLNMDLSADGAVLKPGDAITLIGVDAGKLLSVDANLAEHTLLTQGFSLLYDVTLSSVNNALRVLVNKPVVRPSTESLPQARAASMVLLNMGADLVAGAGMGNALSATRGTPDAAPSSWGLIPFAAISGGEQQVNVGGGSTVQGLSFMTGFAKRFETPSASIVAGAFFEAGRGHLRANTDVGGDKITNKGDTKYTGGGILARVDLTDTFLRGLYAETSFRAGYFDSEYKSKDIRDGLGQYPDYSLGNAYYGAHAGLGYLWDINERSALDVYGKFFWTHQEGKSKDILKEPYTFKKMDSYRTRVGGRLDYAITDQLRPYVGAAWEHEFDGRSRATAYDLSVPSPKASGDTAIGEVGLSFAPSPDSGFSLDCNVQAFGGHRQGVVGNLQVMWKF